MRPSPFNPQLGILLRDGPSPSSGRFRLEIRPASSLFTGHFPDEPLLPGLVHLEIVAQLLGPPLAIAGIDSLRLRRPVRPGDEIELEIEHLGASPTARFEATSAGEAVAAGRGLLLTTQLPPPDHPDRDTEEPTRGAASARLPHAPPALLVREALIVRQEEAVAVCVVPRRHPLARQGHVPGFLAIEAAAQTAGLLAAPEGSLLEPSPAGVLVGVRDATIPAWLPVATPFRVQAWREAEMAPLTVFRFRAEWPGAVAVGQLSTYAGQSRRKQNH